MVITLIVGDESNDGHGKTSTFSVDIKDKFKRKTTKSLIKKAYISGVKESGFDITNYCNDYEDNVISLEIGQFAVKNGIEVPELYKLDAYACDEVYVDIWILIFNFNKLGLTATLQDDLKIGIGGYGCV
jgi:hypothetical protein